MRLSPSPFRASCLARGAASATALGAALACSDLAGPTERPVTFTLRSVGEQALPVELVPVSEGAIVRRWWLDSGRLTLQPNGVLRLRLGVRSQLDAGSVEQSEVEVQGTYTSDGSTISLCLENGCLLRSGSPAHAIGGTVSGRDFVTPALFAGASSPFRFVRE